jgi:hypothetical protein
MREGEGDERACRKSPTTGIAVRERGSVTFEFTRWNMPSNERPGWPTGECIRCGEAPRVDELGYCGHCHWAVRAEVEAGFRVLGEYLRAWALFMDWCAQRGQRIA